MQAEREDAPWSVRQRRKGNTALLLICLTTGCLATGTALLFHHEQLPQSTPPLPVPSSAPLNRTITPTAPVPVQPPPRQRPQPLASTSNPRQTEFNEHNYRPRSDINVIQSVQPQQVLPQVAQSRPPRRLFKSQRWSWEFAGKWHSMPIHWQEVDGRIEWNTVCNNFREGSLDYRTCRREARPMFLQLCRPKPRSPECSAERQYNPLR